MGWRGAIRTFGAAMRAAERDSRRRAREQARQLAQIENIKTKERAAETVQEFEAFLESLVSAHRTCSKPIDWLARASVVPPSKPQRSSEREDAAKRDLAGYTPSRFSRFIGRADRVRAKLEAAVSSSHAADEAAFDAKKKAYEEALAEYEDEQDLAVRVLAKDTDAMLEFIKALNPFGSVAQLAESLRISIPLPTRAAVEVDVHSEEVVPKETAKLLVSGRVSLRAMPKGEYYRLYQDHVCSAALRVAREIIAALPVDSVLVTAVDELVDLSTGNLAKKAILSLLAPRATLERLNFGSLDPSDAMRNFLHQMDFRATSGFRAVEPLDPRTAGTIS